MSNLSGGTFSTGQKFLNVLFQKFARNGVSSKNPSTESRIPKLFVVSNVFNPNLSGLTFCMYSIIAYGHIFEVEFLFVKNIFVSVIIHCVL